MAMTESAGRVYRLASELTEATRELSRQNGMLCAQSVMLIADARRLYEENDRLKMLCEDALAALCEHGADDVAAWMLEELSR